MLISADYLVRLPSRLSLCVYVCFFDDHNNININARLFLTKSGWFVEVILGDHVAEPWRFSLDRLLHALLAEPKVLNNNSLNCKRI